MLHGSCILVVEDEALIAFDIADAVADAGGTVVGPVASVREALEIIAASRIDGAILDRSLVNGNIGAVFALLTAHTTPAILHSGDDPKQLSILYPETPLY